MNIKGIIFDADGPLYFRDKDSYDPKIKLLKKFGYIGNYKKFEDSYEKEKWLRFVGKISNTELIRRTIKDIDLMLDSQSLKLFTKEFLELHKKVKLAKGILKVLGDLKKSKIIICVLTDTVFSKKEKQNLFKNIGMDKYIDKIVCSCDIKKLKDTKEAYEECLKRMRLRANEVIFVGHKEYEMKGANKANIISVAILSISERNIKADYLLRSTKELAKFVNKITV